MTRRPKRPDGALEADVLTVLWNAPGHALSPAEVNERLGTDLAYTTVMTVLTRLWRKGLADRQKVGRGYAYLATLSQSQLATRQIRDTLDEAHDRASVLAGFVAGLSEQDVNQLRRLLADLDNQP